RSSPLSASCAWSAATPAPAEPMRLLIKDLQSIRPDCLLVVSAVIPDALRAAYEADGIPVFEDPSRAVAAVAALVAFGRSFRQPAVQQKSQARAKRQLASAIGDHDAKRLLAAWRL